MCIATETQTYDKINMRGDFMVLLEVTNLFTAIVFLLFILMGVLLVVYVIRDIVKKKQGKPSVNKSSKKSQDELIRQLIHSLGSKSNIVSVSQDGSRLRIKVQDESLVNVNELQQYPFSGIMISSGQVKLSSDLSKEDIESFLNSKGE